MAVYHEWSPNGVVARFEGPLTAGVILHHQDLIFQHQPLDSIHWVLVNFLGITTVVTSEREMTVAAVTSSDIVGYQSKPPSDVKLAVVTDRDDVRAIVNAYMDSHMPGVLIQRYFLTERDALDWVREPVKGTIHPDSSLSTPLL